MIWRGKWNVGRFARAFGSLAGIIAIAAKVAFDRFSTGFGTGSVLYELVSVLLAVVVGALVGAGIALARNAFFS